MTADLVPNAIASAARWAWATSLVAALPALLLLALGRLRRFPSLVRWLAGAALVLRLLLPGVPEIPGTRWMPSPQLVSRTAAVAAVSPAGESPTAEITLSKLPAPSPAVDGNGAFSWLWLAGVATVGIWVLASHAIIGRRIARSALPCDDPDLCRHLAEAARSMGCPIPPPLLVLPGLPTVALSGWFRPRILVPDDLARRFNGEEIRGIFRHELAHVKRHDVLWTWLSLAACALHWFNPLVWLVARRFRADRELECDRRALRTLDAGQRRHFGEALLKTLEGPSWTGAPALVSFAQRQPEIRTRLLMIARPLSPLWTRCLGLLVAPALILLTLTPAAADGEKEPGKAREGEGAGKPAPREGDRGAKPSGARDGEGTRKTGPRDGEGPRKTGAREGEGMKKGAREGEGAAKPRNEANDAAPGKVLTIRVVEGGETVIVDGTKVSAQRLRAHLSEFLPAQAGRPVVIEAEDSVPHKSVLEVLDAARDNGAKKATLATARR